MKIEYFFSSIDHYQSPDRVQINKQWRLVGDIGPARTFKGYMIECTWEGKKDLKVTWDIAENYQRIIGDKESIPLYTPGKHIIRDKD